MNRLGTLPHRLLLCVATAALAVTSAACTEERPQSTSPDPDAVASAAASTTPGQAPLPAERCDKSGNVPAARTVLTTVDNVHLAGVRFGTGERGVLLLPQRGIDLCPWWDYATELAMAGFHVLAVDMRGTGFSESSDTLDYTADAIAGIAELRKSGAVQVVVIGASQGAATALVTAGRVPDQVNGVVALSYPDEDLDVTGGTGAVPRTPGEAAPLIKAPTMLCFTAGDPDIRSADPEQLIKSVKAPGTQLVGRPGVSHGWDMLKLGTDDVRPDVLGFLQSYA